MGSQSETGPQSHMVDQVGTDVSVSGLHHSFRRALLGTGGAGCCPMDLGPVVPAGPWLSCSNTGVTWIHTWATSGLGKGQCWWSRCMSSFFLSWGMPPRWS